MRRCHVRSVTYAHKGRQQLLRGPDECHMQPDWRLTNACAHRVPMHPFCRTCSVRHLLQNTALELQLAIRNAREDVCHRHHWSQPQGRRDRLDHAASSSIIRSCLALCAVHPLHPRACGIGTTSELLNSVDGYSIKFSFSLLTPLIVLSPCAYKKSRKSRSKILGICNRVSDSICTLTETLS